MKMITPRRIISVIVLLALLLTALPFASLAAEMNFTDVPKTAWYYEDVRLAVQGGLVNGKTATTYAPNDNVTYAETVKLAACMYKLTSTGSTDFARSSPWYQTYVDYAKDKNIISGDYVWNSAATRAHFMDIFSRAIPDNPTLTGSKALEEDNAIADGAIPDVPMTHPQAYSIYKLYRAGVVQGSDADRNCLPNTNIKRSEVAAILTRMVYADQRVSFTLGDVEASALRIAKHPQDVTVEAGAAAAVTYTVEATGGKTPYTYQWQRRTMSADWENLSKKPKDAVEATISDVNAQTLRIAAGEFAALSAGGYQFRCVVTDANGKKVTSNAAAFTMKGSPSTSGSDGTNVLADGEFLCYVGDVFRVQSRGIVIQTRVVAGRVNVGDTIQLHMYDPDTDSDTTATVTVAGIEMFRKAIDYAEEKDSVGICIGFPFGKNTDGSANVGLLARGAAVTLADTSLVALRGGYVGTVTYHESSSRVLKRGDRMQFFYGPMDAGIDVSGTLGNFNGTISSGETRTDVQIDNLAYGCVWYIGQEILIREGGRTYATFTVTGVR